MKKIYLSLLFAVVAMFATAQNYQLNVLDFEGTKWSALIDSPQYGGPLLYGEGYGFYTEDEAYSWYDEGNTFLKSTINNAYGSWCYWSGGVAVSNYYNEVEEGTYENQLSVNYNKEGNHGHNNSANFAACFGYNDGNAYSTDSRPLISFGDGVARVIDHLYVINTAYTLNCVLNGSGFNVPATEDTYIDLVVEGFYNGESAGAVKIRLLNGTTALTEWTKLDLSSLGAVDSIKFNYEASADMIGDYGFNFPGYIAIDDIAVRMPIVATATFEDIEIGEEGHMSVTTEDDDDRTEFTSGSYTFATGCMHDWDYWYWFGYANRTKTAFETLDDQWNNIVGGGNNGSANYGVAYAAPFNGPCYVTVPGDNGVVVPGFYITNSSYAYSSMMNGDGYAKKLGLGDWFKLTITGYDADDEVTGVKEFYLADLRETDKAYIINDWRYVDLSGLGKVKKIGFELSSTDNDPTYGIKTPTYFCFDDFGATGTEILPEKNVFLPATFEDIEIGEEGHMSVTTEEDDERTEFTSGDYTFASGCMHDWDYWYWFGYANQKETTYKTLDDQWRNVVGGGYNGSANYGVAYAAAFNGPCYVTVPGDNGSVVPGFYITNSSYAYTSMLNGDGYGKKFELGDWFKLTITGYDANDGITGIKEYYLADLRDADKAYIINDWRYVDLSIMGQVKKIGFELTSTDNDPTYGMKTPAYFCFDDFGTDGTQVLPEKNIDVTGISSVAANKSDNAVRKFFKNGRIVIVKNGKRFSANGAEIK